MEEIVNAQITKAEIEIEDHGILTVGLHLEWPSGGVVFGGHGLDGYDKEKKKRVGVAYGAEYIRRILEALVSGEQKWTKLDGTYVRLRIVRDGGRAVQAIGHITEDRWFDPKELFEEMGDDAD